MTNENFDNFYRKYIEFSAKIAYRILQNRENAEDISQEVFLHFYKIRKKINYSNEKMLESLVFTATANKCKDHYKKSWIKQEMCIIDADRGIETADERQNPEKVVLRKEEENASDLKRVLSKFQEENPTNYDILIKTKMLGIPPDAVAEEYGITRNNVNNRNKRSKEWIDRELKKMRKRL